MTDAASRLRAAGYDPAKLVDEFQTKGYVVLEGILSADPSSPLSLDNLRKSAGEAIQQTRRGDWPHRRVVGNAFPPFDKENPDSWGVQHLMNPAIGAELSTTFQQFYGSSPLLEVASVLLDSPAERMQMELFNLLINPEAHCFALGWHRDDIKPDVDETEELARLDTPTYGVQFNTALYDDDCLFIVPGSHARLRTEAERLANQAKAPAAVEVVTSQPSSDSDSKQSFDGSWDVDPPSTLRVNLKAGQTVFYSQRILHRASYRPDRKRATLHACYGDTGDGDQGAAERARNILQHGVQWMRDDSFRSKLPEKLGPMYDNLIKMEAKWEPETLGYSLSND